jgi:hypothetical protein
MNFKKLAIACLLTISTTVLAGEGDFIISIDKAGVRSKDVKKAVKALNYTDFSTGLCFVESRVTDYIDYSKFVEDPTLPETPYHGVAIVHIKWECLENVNAFLKKIDDSPKYTLYSNPPVDPNPAVSGSN